MNAHLLNRIALVLSFIGLFIAGTLSLAHHTGAGVACGPQSGCNEVAAWVQRNWNNFPVADVGLVGYVMLASLFIYNLIAGITPKMAKIGFFVALGGLVASIGLTMLSITVINAKCIYCLSSAATMLALAGVTFVMMRSATEFITAPKMAFDKPLIAMLAVACISGIVWGNSRNVTTEVTNLPDKIEDLIPEKPNGLGDPKAEFILVEFMDPYCPFCRISYQQMKSHVQRSNGKLYVVYRHFPLKMEGHEHSQLTANIAEIAADEGKFLSFYDALFQSEPKETTVPMILAAASSVGISEETIQKRAGVTDDPAFKRLYDDIQTSDKMGMTSTPVIFFGRRGQAPRVLNAMRYAADLAEAGVISGP
jgi:protein-disulfide isomerase